MYFPLLYSYLFWAESDRVRRMNLAKNVKLTFPFRGDPWALSLDHIKKRVYGVDGSDGIFSSNYDGVNMTTFRGGSFNENLLDIFADSVYSQRTNVPYINEINMTSGKISRSIKVNRTDYRDLVVVHSSLQPMGELQKSFQCFWDFM